MENQIQALVDAPSERLNIEVKPWLDPSSNWGEAIIAKALLALRNQNGGFLLIGFNDDGSPGSLIKRLDIKSAFHIDNIQQIVFRYASRDSATASR
jgi:predicted HTH transcriptional regulator